MTDSIHFLIPARVDQLGMVVEHRSITASRRLLPVLAQVVENATRPRLLTQQYELDGLAVMSMTDGMLEHLRDRTRYDLEHGLREEAKKQGLAVITAVTFDEHSSGGRGILFTAQATAMPLLDKGIER